MKKKHTYATVDVDKLVLSTLLPVLVGGCIVGIDVAKEKFVVALTTMAGEVVKLLRFRHPDQTSLFVALVRELIATLRADQVLVALEPTGTYGDAVRHQVERLGARVVMVSPKAVSDSREVFDGVPSLHDGKSACLIAKLTSLGRCAAYVEPSPRRRALRALVEQRLLCQAPLDKAFGRIEAQLARHWPELSCWMDVREQKSALVLLAEFGDPARVAANESVVRATLRKASRGMLTPELIDGVIGSARTVGVPMNEQEVALLRSAAAMVLEHQERAGEVEKTIGNYVKGDAVMASLAKVVGAYSAAVLVSMLDPMASPNARAFEKACGLNLKEKSSGELKGRLSLTKRGPAVVRQILYLAALRLVQSEPLMKLWYERRKSYGEGCRQRAVVAVMRKLIKALWHVARGAAFDMTKLVDTRRLAVVAEGNTVPPRVAVARTTARSTVRSSKRQRRVASPNATPSASAGG